MTCPTFLCREDLPDVGYDKPAFWLLALRSYLPSFWVMLVDPPPADHSVSTMSYLQHARSLYASSTRTKWFPHAITLEELRVGERFLTEHAPHSRAAERLHCLRECMFRLHGEFDRRHLAGMIGQWILSELAPGTIESYISTMFTGEQGGPFARVRAAISKAHALATPRHAADLSPLQLGRVLAGMSRRNAASVAASELILRTGMRCADIRWTRRRLILAEQKRLIVTIVWAKNIRSRSGAVTCEFPLWFGPVSDFTLSYLRWCPPDSYPFRDINASTLNRCYDATAHPECTTYSFRRAFIQRALEAVEGNAEEVARRWTFHKNPRMILAHYAKRADEVGI